MSEPIDELFIIKKLANWIDDGKFPFQMARCFIYGWECDYWTMTQGGETREFEIKISRADYLKDKKKDKHKATNGANYFYYVCPEGLISKDEVEQGYGLIYIKNVGGNCEVVKKPRQLNKNPFTDWKQLACKFYWKFRDLWRQKYIAKEITRTEYHEGLNLELQQCEQSETIHGD